MNMMEENNTNRLVEEADIPLVLSSHTESIVDIITIDKEHILSLSVDNTVKYWSIDSNDFGRLIQTINAVAPTKMFMLSDRKIIIPNYDNTLSIYDRRLRPVDPLILYGHDSWCMNYCELHDKRLATCSRDKTIKIWSMQSSECSISLEGHSDIVNCVRETNDQLILSGSSDCSVKVWMLFDEDQYQCLSTINDGFYPVFQIEVLEDEMLVTRNESPIMNLWNYKLGEKVMAYSTHQTNTICFVVLFDKRIASGSYDRSIKIWNTKSEMEDATLIGHDYTVFAIKELSNMNIISASGDYTLKCWELKTYTCLRTFRGHNDFVISINIIDEHHFISGSYDNTLRTWMIE